MTSNITAFLFGGAGGGVGLCFMLGGFGFGDFFPIYLLPFIKKSIILNTHLTLNDSSL